MNPSPLICQHGMNRTACPTCYQARLIAEKEAKIEAAKKRQGPFAPPREVTAVLKVGAGPEAGAFSADKLWEPPTKEERDARLVREAAAREAARRRQPG